MRIGQALGLLALTGAMFLGYLGYAGAAPASADTGYRDFSYGNGINNSPTGEKPQSKLWFNDGTWWGLLFDAGTEDWYIYRFDQSTQTWSKTSTLVEPRSSARSDVLWDGSRLYVASAPSNTQSTNLRAQLKRFSYDKASKSYTLDAGFPATVASNPLEAIVLDKDTTGKLWVTYTQGSKVYVNRSLTSDSSWGTPFVLPVNGTTVDPDDISAVVAFDSKIGVMWSNQTDGTFYFATHNDGDPDNAWQGGVAMQGNKYSDDHINLKSLQADSSGRVFAAVKTSVGDLANSDSNAPLIDLLVLGTNGMWKQPVTFGRVQDDHTRPIVIIDEQNRNLYMFATAPVGGGTIYYKQASLDRISFANGKGTPFIQSSADTAVNNATSTKQNVNSASGLVVLASDPSSKYYLHNTLNLNSNNADTTAPTVSNVTPEDAATGVAAADNIGATFSEDVDSSTLTASTFTLLKQGATTPLEAQVSYDSATKKATLDPNADLDPSTPYTATINGGTSGVKDLAGNPLAQDRSWSFTTAALPQDTTPPETAMDSGPSETVNSRSSSFTFSSSEANTTFECKLDAANFAPCTSPKDYSELADGSHTFEVRAIDAANNVDATPASRTWTVDTVAPDTTIDSGPSDTITITDAMFTFSSEAGATFECSLDGAAYSACTSPESYTNLSYGSHTFEVKATDAAGNVDATPASRTFSVVLPPPQDITPPETTIDSGPSGTVSSASASFTFSSNEVNSTFECSLDGGAFAPCTSLKSYADLTDGSHTFEVRATDAAGNTDATPATRTWTVATTTSSLTSTADTKLVENASTTNYGGVTSLAADGDEPAKSGKDAYSLLRWDLSTIPSGSRVSSVSITLNITNSSINTYQLYELERPWVESTATWLLSASQSPWEIAGAKGSLDRGAQLGSVSPSAKGKQTFTLSASVVQGWIDDPSSNPGIIIANATNADGFDFSSREAATSGNRPQLNVTYTAP